MKDRVFPNRPNGAKTYQPRAEQSRVNGAAPPWVAGQKMFVALKGRNNSVSLLRTFRACVDVFDSKPRAALGGLALPWADMFGPFGASWRNIALHGTSVPTCDASASSTLNL